MLFRSSQAPDDCGFAQAGAAIDALAALAFASLAELIQGDPLALIVVGAVKLVRDVIFYRGPYVPGVTLMLILTAIQVGAIGLLADLIVKRAR